MGYSKELFERADEDRLDAGGSEQQNSMRSVQNLEAVINEGLRAALLEETPDQSLKVLLEHLGKALREAMTTPMSGWPKAWSRRRRVFKMFRLRCVRSGMGISESVNISSLKIWKKSERMTP